MMLILMYCMRFRSGVQGMSNDAFVILVVGYSAQRLLGVIVGLITQIYIAPITRNDSLTGYFKRKCNRKLSFRA